MMLIESLSSKDSWSLLDQATEFFSTTKDLESLRADVDFVPLTSAFINSLEQRYDSKDLVDFKPDLQSYISQKIVKFSVRDALEKIGIESMYDIITTTKNSLLALFKDDAKLVVDEYVALWKAWDMSKIRTWLNSQWVSSSNAAPVSNNHVSEPTPESISYDLDSRVEAYNNPLVQEILAQNNIDITWGDYETLRLRVVDIEKITYNNQPILKTYATQSKTPAINAVILPDLLLFALEFQKAHSSPLELTSSYRTYESQQELHDSFINGWGNLAAKPGHSNHNFWLAIDIHRSSKSKMSLQALQTLAKKYNFNSIASEDWHFDHEYARDIWKTPALAQNIQSSYRNDYSAVA